MVKYNEIKAGNYVVVDNDGDKKRGEVINLNGNEKQVCVDNGVQQFWYETDQLIPLELNDQELSNLKFHKEILEQGTVKYSKGAFRMIIPKESDFSAMEIWYRDEKRHVMHPIHLHQLQNHFYEMTKVHLNDEVFD